MKSPEEEGRGEPELWRGRPAWAEYSFLWFFASIFALRSVFAFRTNQNGSAWVYGMGVFLFTASAVFLRQRTVYRLTRRGLYKSMGILGQKDRRVPLDQIAAVSVRQGPIDRLFDIGILLVNLKSGRIERLIGIKDPEVVERKINALL